MDKTNEVLFAQALGALGAPVDSGCARRLSLYHALLNEWNTRMNLTGDTALETALSRLYMDSLAPLAVAGLFAEGARVLDVGSGAGFPGLPLAIARPDLQVMLLDSLRKRVAFLDQVIAVLGLTNVCTVHARAEDAARNPSCREQFDIVAARAVAAVPVLLELLLPFARVGGKAVCYKGPSAEEEIAAGTRAARILGGGAVDTFPVAVPGQPDWQHCVLVCPKERPTARVYPRKAGTPAREPLGG